MGFAILRQCNIVHFQRFKPESGDRWHILTRSLFNVIKHLKFGVFKHIHYLYFCSWLRWPRNWEAGGKNGTTALTQIRVFIHRKSLQWRLMRYSRAAITRLITLEEKTFTKNSHKYGTSQAFGATARLKFLSKYVPWINEDRISIAQRSFDPRNICTVLNAFTPFPSPHSLASFFILHALYCGPTSLYNHRASCNCVLWRWAKNNEYRIIENVNRRSASWISHKLCQCTHTHTHEHAPWLTTTKNKLASSILYCICNIWLHFTKSSFPRDSPLCRHFNQI
jgi:hypothetical protein